MSTSPSLKTKTKIMEIKEENAMFRSRVQSNSFSDLNNYRRENENEFSSNASQNLSDEHKENSQPTRRNRRLNTYSDKIK
eukprot:Pgem_evm1s13674